MHFDEPESDLEREPVLDELASFARDSGLSLSYICKLAVNNSDLAKRIEDGKTLTSRTERKLRRFITAERIRRNLPLPPTPDTGAKSPPATAQFP